MTLDRRTFLADGVLVLAGITAGTVTSTEATMSTTRRREFLKTISPVPGATQSGDPVMGFGWEIVNIDNSGADVFFEVRDTMILNAINVDVAFMITSLPSQPGFAEVLCDGGVSRGVAPKFSAPPQAYIGFVANVYSTNVPPPEVWQYPPNQIAPFAAWVDAHPQGTPIVVRYDPANHKKVVLVATDMPRGGPHTPNNVKLLEVCAGSFLVLLTIARITRPRPQSL
jgi:hypothetical protein